MPFLNWVAFMDGFCLPRWMRPLMSLALNASDFFRPRCCAFDQADESEQPITRATTSAVWSG
jgi:hypothetical protein